MKLHLNLSLRRALLAAMAAVATFAPSATAGVMHSDATYQTYTDFGQNCGRYVVGSKVNALLSHIRKEAGGITIDYTDGNDSYVISNEQGMISFNATHDGGHSTAIGPNFLATVRHNGSLNASFSERTVGSNYALNYEAIDINNTTLFRLSPEWGDGKYDYMLQRQSKVVTDVSWNPITTLTNEQIDNLDGGLVYHSGAGMMYKWDEETQKYTYLSTGYRYIIGTINGITNGLIQNDPKHPDEGNLSVLQDPHYGQSGHEGASEQNPLPNAVRPGDSGSPVFIYNTETNQYEYIAAQQSIIEPSFGQARGNVVWTHETLSAFDSSIDMSTSGTIHLGAVSQKGDTISETLNAGTEKEVTYSTTLYSGIAIDGNGNKAGEYIGVQTGVNTWCNLYDRRNIENWYAYQKKDGKGNVISDLQVSDEDLFYTQNLVFTPSQATNNIILDATVDLGIGYAEFNKGANMEKAVFNITAGTAGAMFNHAGYVINEGAEVHLKLVNPVVDETQHMTEWRKIGAGDLYIDGTGDTNALLNVGGSGKTYLQQTAGHAAYNVLVNSGATVIINGIGQIERDLTFGAGGGTLDLNGSGVYDNYNWLYNIDWYTTGGENRDGFTINALTEEAMITNSKDTVQLTYKQSGNTSYAGSFSDTASSALIVAYDGGSDSTWTLNSIHTNLSNQQSGFVVKSGTVILSGTNTVHGMGSATATNTNRLELENDWHYADATMGVQIDDGATFVLGSHARLKGQVVVDNGGTFVIREAVKHQYEYVEGGSSLEDTYQYADYYGYKGIGRPDDIDIYLRGSEAKLTIKYSEGTTANTTIDANIYGQGSVSVDAGISGGSLTLGGDNSGMSGTKTLISGGLIATGANSLGNTSPNKWKVQEKGWIASHAHRAADLLAKIDTSSTGILALSENTANALNLTNYNNLYIGAEAGKVVDYGTANATLEAVNGAWRLGGSGGTLNVNFKLDGTGNLIIGNEYSTGTVNLTNAANKINGDIIIMGSGNILTYSTLDALGGARVALSYGNSLALHNQTTLSLLSDDAKGIMLLSESLDLDMTGYKVALGASGKQTYTGKITLGENDSYRFGGSGHLTLDTVLDESQSMILDGQSNSGSSVTFARENAFTGGHIIAMGGEKGDLSGSISVYAGHANSFADLGSMQLQKGATLYTDGYTSMTVQNLSASAGSSIRNSGSRDTALRLNVTKDITTEIADGVLNDANNSAGLSLIKTGEGTLTMGGNRSWSGGLTIKEGTVAISAGNGGVGTDSNVINIEDDGILRVTANHVGYTSIGNTIIKQKLTGTGTIEVANGKDMMLTQQAAGFEGTVHVMDNTRLYVGSGMSCDYDANPKYNTVQAFNDASIRVDSGSQVRITNSYYHVSSATVVSDADYFISGTGKAGTVGSELVHENLTDGALSIDCGSIITGSVTLEADATIASWSVNPAEECYNKESPFYNNTDAQKVLALNNSHVNNPTLGKHYGVQGYLGGTIRGQILGQGKTLTIGGNESMTFTADSANTFGDLVISNGNGNNTDKFALCLDGGKAMSQTSTALGTGKVTLNEGLILRLAGTGVENQAHVVYTYGNDIDAGANATLQSHNITNKLTGTVTTTGNLNLATDHGGVLHLAGGFAIAESAQNTTQTLTIAAGSSIRIGSGEGDSFSGNVIAGAGVTLALDSNTALSADSTISGTDSLTLCLGGANAYTLGGIELNNSESVAENNLTLRFDFTSAPNVGTEEAWCFLTSSITADSLIVGIDLNMFNSVKSGTYILLNNIGDLAYTLENNYGNRLSISVNSNNQLQLTVNADERLFWRADANNSGVWDTAAANWGMENAEGELLPSYFTTGDDVFFSDIGNDEATRETISLAADTEAGCVLVQTSHYEITGDHKLNATELRIGEGANLTLSTDSAEVAEQLLVNNAKLTVEGTELAADITATNAATVNLVADTTVNGDITTSNATLGIDNSTVTGKLALAETKAAITHSATVTGDISFNHSDATITDQATVNGNIELINSTATITEQATVNGNISLSGSAAELGDATINGNIAIQDASTLSMDGTKLKGEMNLGNEGRFIAGTYNGSTVTYQEATLSGTMDSDKGNQITLDKGTATLQGSFNQKYLGLGADTKVVIWNENNTIGEQKQFSTLALGKNSNLDINNRGGETNESAVIKTLVVDESASINEVYNAGHLVVEKLDMAQGNASATLILNKDSKNSGSAYTSVYDFGTSTSVGGNFAGQVVLNNTSTSMAKHSAFINLYGKETLANAAVILNTQSGAEGYLGLGINVHNAQIGGLQSSEAIGNRALLFSGSAPEDKGWNTHDGADMNADEIARTLIINTASGTEYEFFGQVREKLSLVKDGAGKQSFSGNSAVFNGSIEIVNGTMAFNGDAINMLSSASSVTVSGGTLDISSYDFNNGDTLQVNELSISEKAVLALGNLNADTTYYFFSTTQDNWAALTTDNFSLNGISLSDYGRVNLNLGMDGAFSFTLDESWNLIWDGGSEKATWTTAAGNYTWLTSNHQDGMGEDGPYNTRFTNNDNVLFNSDANLELEGNIIVNNMEVADGVSLVTHGKLTVKGDITVGSNFSWDFSGDTTLSFTEAELVSAKKIVVGDGATLVMTDVTTGANYQSAAFDNVSGTGDIKLLLAVDANNGQATGNGIGIDSSNISGDIIVQQGRLQVNTSAFNEASTIKLATNASELVFNATCELKNDIELQAVNTVYVNKPSAEYVGTISGDISGSGTLNKAGGGTLILTGNSRIGDLTISNGTVKLSGQLTLTNEISTNKNLSQLVGAGVLNLQLSGENSDWNKTISTGTEFAGEVQISKGCMTLDGSSVGKGKLVLMNDSVDIQLTTSKDERTWEGNLELRGTHDMHSNSGTDFTFSGNVTGTGTYVKNSSGTLTFGATGSVDLGGFKQEDGETNFAGKTKLGKFTQSGGTTNFSGETELGGIEASNCTIQFYNDTEITGKVNHTSSGDFRTLGGEIKLMYAGEDGNYIRLIDGSNGGAARGTVRLGQNVKVSADAVFGTNGSSVVLEQGATLIHNRTTEISNRGTADASLKTLSSAQVYGTGNTSFELTNGHIKTTATNVTISNKLTNSSVENAGGGVLTVTHTGNTLSGVVASAGDITLQNLAANTSLNLLEIAAGHTVNAYVGTNVDEKQGVSVASTGTALLSGGATLNTSLTLADGATLEMYNLTDDSSVTINGALTFNGQVKLGTKLLAAVNALTGWEESLTLFTGLAGGVSLPSTVATNADEMVRASEVFSNVTNGNLYVSYQVIDNVGSLMVINVPEPTTTTLSLLALSALAARRRRKN